MFGCRRFKTETGRAVIALFDAVIALLGGGHRTSPPIRVTKSGHRHVPTDLSVTKWGHVRLWTRLCAMTAPPVTKL